MECQRMLEKAFQEQHVVPAFKRNGFSLIYHVWRSDHSPAGFPDVLAVNPERGLLDVVELKRMIGKTTPEQDAWLDGFSRVERVRVHGVWRPSDIERLDDLLAVRG